MLLKGNSKPVSQAKERKKVPFKVGFEAFLLPVEEVKKEVVHVPVPKANIRSDKANGVEMLTPNKQKSENS